MMNPRAGGIMFLYVRPMPSTTAMLLQSHSLCLHSILCCILQGLYISSLQVTHSFVHNILTIHSVQGKCIRDYYFIHSPRFLRITIWECLERTTQCNVHNLYISIYEPLQQHNLLKGFSKTKIMIIILCFYRSSVQCLRMRRVL